MFQHKGETRTLKHNLQIASLLSFVAGIVNVVGFLSVQRLTTNVTGHFAYFMDEVLKLNFWQGLIYFFYIVFFFLGSFASNLLIEAISRKNERFMYTVPIVIECFILMIIGFYGHRMTHDHSDTVAFSLLFAMGLQNSLVTTISNAQVRTTHLTGLFTDLGIEMSQLFFYKSKDQRHKLSSSIKLRLTIITFFFIGGLIGGISYSATGFSILIFSAAVLALGLVYDYLKFGIIYLHQRIKREP